MSNNKLAATFHPYSAPTHMCAQTIPGPRYLDAPDPCEYESVPGFDFCDRHLRDERDFDAALKHWKETR